MGKELGKVNPGRKRVRVGKDFKLEAVKLLESGQKPAVQRALELGIRRNQLYKWQAQLREQARRTEQQDNNRGQTMVCRCC